jgi:DNA-binding response OmpR family regulator
MRHVPEALAKWEAWGLERLFMEGRILILDSNTAFGTMLVQYFSEHDFMAHAPQEFTIGITDLKSGKYDIAIVELCWKKRQDKIAQTLKRRAQGTSIILTCSRHSHEQELRARSLSPAFYFVKPFEMADLFAVVVRIFEMKNKQRILAVQRMKRREGVMHG